MAGPRVYVLDDEPLLPRVVEAILPHADVQHFEDGDSMLRAMERRWPDAVVCDLAVQRPREGFEVLQQIFTRWPRRKIFALLVTRYFSPDLWKAVQRWGVGALDISDLGEAGAQEKLTRALARFIPETWEYQQELLEVYEEEGYIARSPRMAEVLMLLERWKDADHPIVIVGDTGVGKTHLAKILGRRSRNGQYILVNAPSITADTTHFHVELFGEEPGPYSTSLTRTYPGYLELTGEGTLILDEFSTIPQDVQASLLRVVEERRFERLGSGRDHLFMGRLIFLTNSDPEVLVRQGKLRRDLWSRLKAYTVSIPPLRERPEDVERFLNVHGRHLTWNQKARKFLVEQYNHPFNFRGLRHLVERLTREEVSHVGLDDVLRILGAEMPSLPREESPAQTGTAPSERGDFLEQLIAWMERENVPVDHIKTLLVHHLERTRGSYDRNPDIYRKLGISRSAYYRHRAGAPSSEP